MQLAAVVLAAGQGTRMRSSLPKVLHPLSGRPLIYYSVRAALDAGAGQVIVVIGHGGDAVLSYVRAEFGERVRTARQHEQHGTGHAAQVALPELDPAFTHTLILYGDTPLLEVVDLKALAAALDAHHDVPLALLTCIVDDPTGYGRVLRDERGQVACIREHRDLQSEQERNTREVNPGVYAMHVGFARTALSQLRSNNAQNELYLTDVVEAAHRQGRGAMALVTGAASLIGINDRAQLSYAEASMNRRILDRHGRAGITLHGTPRIDDTVRIEPDVTIWSGAVLRGATRIGEGTTIDTGSVITDSNIGPRVTIRPYSVITSSTVHAEAQIGPFAHLRPESDIGERAHIGNFVETKKTVVHSGAKANHLAYLGDGIVGEDSNIGAGTIFCNYDGVQKHQTVLGKGVFVGSDSQLVAPLHVGDGAYIATGTTVTQDVPADALAIGRARQENKLGYASRLRSRFAAQRKAKLGR